MSLVWSNVTEKMRRRAGAFFGLVIGTVFGKLVATDPTISAGTGAPTELEPDGSEWIRTDGDAATIRYYRVAGAWVDRGALSAGAALIDSASYFYDNGDSTKRFAVQCSGITTGTTRTWTVPDVSDTFVGLAATQALTNKTLGNTTTITVKDTLFTIQDDGDATKLLAFQVSGIATGNTRTLTVQDVSGTIYVSGGTDIPVTDGGTGASTAADARTNLGVVIGTNVQAYSATLDAHAAESLDAVVVATVAAPNGSGGTNTSAVTVQLYRRDGTTPIASVREVLLTIGTVLYLDAAGPSNASVSFGAPGAGTITTVVAGSQFLIATDATGLFSATMTETDDGTLYLSVKTASGGVSAIGRRADVRGSNSTTTVFSA